MFRRLVFEETAALFTIAAFITALSIYLTISWRALRMKRATIERFENLPFETATPASMAAVGVALRVSAGTKFAPSADPVGLPLVGRPRHGDERRPCKSAPRTTPEKP